MNTHTPGPWTLEAGRNFVTSSGEFYLTYGNDKYGNAKFKNFVELDANARLIAQAPRMVEFVNTVMGFWPDKVKAHPDVKILLEEARAILRAVKGE